MNQANTHLVNRAAELRTEFDLSFTAPHHAGRIKVDGFLEIKAGDGIFALRLAEISGLFADKKITPIPSPAFALLGVASFRGVITPVYSLEAIFEKTLNSQPRWLAVSAIAQVALAFSAFNGHTQRSSEDILPAAPDQRTQQFVRHFLPVGPHLRPIIDIEAVVAEIRNLSAKSMP